MSHRPPIRNLIIHALLLYGLTISLTVLIDSTFPFEGAYAPLRTAGMVLAVALFILGLLFLLRRYLTQTRPHVLPHLRRSLSLRRARTFATTRPRLTRLTLLVTPLLFLCLLSLARTLAIQTNDLFYFGHADRWACSAVLNYLEVGCEIGFHEPGYPVPPITPGWFYTHLAADSAEFAVSPDHIPGATTVVRNYHLVELVTTYAGGVRASQCLRLRIPYLLPLLTLLFAVPPFLWIRSYFRHTARVATGLCTVCSYDLRAHLAGGASQRCPECGTPIPPPI